MITVAIKSVGQGWQEFEIPVTKDQLEQMRKQWRDWQKKHKDQFSSGDQSTARSVTGIDEMNISDFDKIILGFAITGSIRYKS